MAAHAAPYGRGGGLDGVAGVAHRVDGAGSTSSSSTARAMPSLDSGSSTGTQRSSPNQYTSIVGPLESSAGQQLVAPPRGARHPKRDRRGRLVGHQRRERRRDVVDDPELSVHAVMIRRWSATPSRSTRRGAEEWRDHRRPRFLDQAGPWPRRHRRARSPPTSAAARGSTSRPRRPVVALDAAYAMVALAREAAPDAWRCRPTSRRCRSARHALGAVGRGRATSTSRTSGSRCACELHQALVVGAPAHLVLRAGRRAVCSATTTSRALLRAWTARRLADVLVGAGFDGRLVRDRRRRRVGSTCSGHARPHAPRLRRARHAAARLRAQPERVRGRRRRRLRPARQPLLARGAWPPGSSRATATRARARRPRRRHDRPGEAGDRPRRRAHPRRVPRRTGAGRAHSWRGCSRARCASSASPASAPRSTARRRRACSPPASEAGPPT